MFRVGSGQFGFEVEFSSELFCARGISSPRELFLGPPFPFKSQKQKRLGEIPNPHLRVPPPPFF